MAFDQETFRKLSAEERLKQTFYLVEATHHEQFCLWNRWAKDSQDCKGLHLRWEQSNGYLVTIGTSGKRPIVVGMHWDIIEDHPVCFWEPTSELVDYALIEEWFDKHYQGKTKDGRQARTNVDNFGHVTQEMNLPLKSDPKRQEKLD